MLYSLGPGREADPLGVAWSFARETETRLAAAADPAQVALRRLQAPGGSVGYLCRFAPEAEADPGMAERLGALAAAMTADEPNPARRDSRIPPVWTYFARFLEHDMAALADVGAAGGSGLFPRRREEVERSLVNLRDGVLRLDSLYRVDAGAGPLAEKLGRLMREPEAPARMRLDRAGPSGLGATPLPADRGADVLRLGRLLSQDPARGVTRQELMALPADLREGFLRGGEPDVSRPVTGDRRNDANLILSQLHLALLRFHNRVADWGADQRGAQAEGLFEATARLVRWHVQWIALNEFLPRLCEPGVLGRIRRAGAPVYAEFCAAERARGGGRLPLPLEFLAAASRFRVSMIRGAYDHNRWHGRPAEGSAPCRPRAELEFLASAAEGRLPADRVIEWDRYVGRGTFPDRGARLIDTNVSPGQAHEGAFRSLALATLMGGHRLNLPSAQDCIGEFNAVYDGLIRPLGAEALASGHTGEALRRGGFVERTPLWFYILKEAEVQQGGERLGQLGTALVAETLAGVMAQDPGSVLNQAGPDGGPWTPARGARPDGRPVDGIEALLRAAEVL